MWPNLFGPGWIWDALLSAGFLAAVAVTAGALLRAPENFMNPGRAGEDRLQQIWHRYEEGDLTPWEFARLMSPRQAVQYSAGARNGVARRVPVH
jgi:hypothetical protein